MSNVFERTEKKYILDASQRSFILNELRDRMRPDAFGESTIRNIYYDTYDFRLARKSIEKPFYKEKLRVRSYKKVTADEKVFVELKKKYNGIVYKRRTKMTERKVERFLHGEPDPERSSQIDKEILYFCKKYGTIQPQVFLSYDREAYFSKTDPDLRISFDKNIRWRTDALSLREDPGGRDILVDGVSIMEIKAAGAMPLWLVDILNRSKARNVSFSKYGTAYRIMLMEGSLEYLRNLQTGNVLIPGRLITGREAAAYA